MNMGTLQILFLTLLAVTVIDSKVKKKVRQEIITVTQHTASPRAKRDIYTNPEGLLNGDDFPDTMDFTLHLKESDYMIHLSKHVTPQDVKLRDQNGKMYFDNLDEKFQFAVYQDHETYSSMIVECMDSRDSCTLKGSFYKDGSRWLLQSLKDVPGKYNVTEINFDYDPISAKKLTPDNVQDTNKQGIVNKIMEYFTKNEKRAKRDTPIIRGQNIMAGDQTREERSVPNILGAGRSNQHIQKRSIHTTCNVIELQAIVDATVYQYYYDKFYDEYLAKVEIFIDLLQLFGEADLRYKCLITEGICIRIYLTDVVFQMNPGSDFIHISTDGPDFFDVYSSIDSLRQLKTKGDLVVGFSRLQIDFNDDRRFRGAAYGDVLCNNHESDYQAIIMELLGDNDDLLLDHLILYTMNVLWDDFYLPECQDADFFTGSLYVEPPAPGKEHNPWLFSTCSIERINIFLNTRSSCLKDGNIDEKRLEAEAAIRILPGQFFDFDHLCQETYGEHSFACQAAGETSIFDVEDICDQGVYCDVYGNCVNRTRVPNGFPCGCNKYCFKNKCEFGETAALGENCTGCCTCSEPYSECDCETQTCRCIEGFYEAPNGTTCLEGSGLNDPCVPGVEGQCEDPNTECSYGTCVCSDGFVECSSECLPYVGINGHCECEEQCNRTSGSCVNNRCKCTDLTTHFVDSCGVCQDRIENNDICSGDALCLDPRAFCDWLTDTCLCPPGTFDTNGNTIGGNCSDQVSLGDGCTCDHQCEDEFAVCALSNTCECGDGYVDCPGGEAKCEPAQAINEACICDLQCDDVGGFCGMGFCKCNPTLEYVDECGTCTERPDLDDDCSGAQVVCLDPNAFCDPNTDTCLCAECFYDSLPYSNGGVCEEKVSLGDGCTFDHQCKDEFAVCAWSNTCECGEGYVDCPGGEAKCEPVQAINGGCNCDEQCEGINGVCNVAGFCSCPPPINLYSLDDSGVCQFKRLLGENCSDAVPCLDDKAYCDPCDEICVCANGFFILKGGCTQQAGLGESCYSNEECADSSANCTGGFCECVPGFIKQNGVCECEPPPTLCGLLPTDPNGYWALTDTFPFVGNLAQLFCCDGYEVQVTSQIECTPSGWSNPANVCQVIECDLPNPSNGEYVFEGSGSSIPVGTFALLECDYGFGPSNEDTFAICQPSGFLSAGSATCIVDCGIPLLDNNFGYYVLNQSRTLEGDIATLFCCEEFFVAGTVEITCLASGEWSDPANECIGCPDGDWYKFGSSCYFPRDHQSFWHDAVDFCNAFDGTEGFETGLVVIETMEENDFVKGIMDTVRYGQDGNELIDSVFLPGNINWDSCQWCGFWNAFFEYGANNGGEAWFPDNISPTFTDWEGGQPNDLAGGSFDPQYCTAQVESTQFTWSDIECATSLKAGGRNGRKYNAFCELDLSNPL